MSSNQLAGAAGEALVSFLVHHELGWVLRDQRQLDVGIDGQIEIVDDGKAAGLLLGAQVKSGPSVFKESAPEGWYYRPSKRDNVDYWLRYPMPVLLVLADNATKRAYWQLVSTWTLVSTGIGWKILVPRVNELNANAKDDLRALATSQHTDLASDLVALLHKTAQEKVTPPDETDVPASAAKARGRAALLLNDLEANSPSVSADIDGKGVRALLTQLVGVGFGHLDVLLGYRLPNSSALVDVVLCGTDPCTAEAIYVLVELKAWANARALFDDLVLADDSALPTLHPVEQVRRYRDYLVHGGPGLKPESVHCLAYLYNAHETAIAGLNEDGDAPLYTVDTGARLAEQLRTVFDAAPLAETQMAADLLLDLRRTPPKAFLKAAAEEIQGRERIVLMDEQQVAFTLVTNAVEQAALSHRKTVVVVLGGPGSGKSTIAMSLYAELARRGQRVYHATGSRSFTSSLRTHIGFDNPQARAMFKYINNFTDTEPASLDVLLCDEAHRVRESSVSQHGARGAWTPRSQMEELITAARVPVFFLDENQIVHPGETGSLASITAAAQRLGRDVVAIHLRGHFRSQVLDAWVDGLLRLNSPVRSTPWSEMATRSDCDAVVHSANSPQELESWLRSRQEKEGGIARITAGYCWTWSDPITENGTTMLLPDVQIGEWSRPWHAKPGKPVPGVPQSDSWATDERGFGQVGGVYITQGVDYDWVGVIFGNDFVWRGDRWVARRKYSHDPVVNRAAESDFTRLIRNTYRVLLTRGIRGVCVYSVDQQTQEYLRAMVG
ncbi:DNA/RNA helicase domain-containing protein [Lentzea pudingi]|uniref:DNA/RNA helicase domain-containing protein n=1 Tax=Lentzea pudingi TaxID=1789439 RepID=UPI00166B6CC6|nr:DNA/RNA helicase domain-containing protein [Lentzea pudingi]